MLTKPRWNHLEVRTMRGVLSALGGSSATDPHPVILRSNSPHRSKLPLASAHYAGKLQQQFATGANSMRFLLSLAVLAGASLAVPALAEDAPAAATSSAKAAKPKKVCRADASLGSVMPRYVCHSKEEWAAIDKATQSRPTAR
jgi:hypothetical protein